MSRKEVITTRRAHTFVPLWVRQRELRQRLPLGHSDALYKSLYSSISRCHSWNGGETSGSDHGGLFSLDFSPDGTHLVAGCVKNSFLVFDPLSRRLIRTVHNAHPNHLSHVKFLDSRIFATGGNDGSVSLWDTRNLKSRFQTLKGHSSSIENIEISRTNDLLITSGQDGIIFVWDMNNWNKREEFKNNTLMSHELMCLRLNPDGTKMIIATASGYCLIVHELDLNTLAQDLKNFELTSEFANMHHMAFASSSHFLFSNCQRNRVEIVADFPDPSRFNIISALEIHPQGWSVFSRCKDELNSKEWTCVHDIQEKKPPEDGTVPREVSEAREARSPQRLEWFDEERLSASRERGDIGSLRRARVVFYIESSNDYVSELPDAAFSLERGADARISGSPTGSTWARSPRAPSSASPNSHDLAGIGSSPFTSPVQDRPLLSPIPSVAQFDCLPRLTHYIEESFCNDVYVDTLGVSADGRLVCSLLDHGIRLLAFSPECSEQSVSSCGTYPMRLHEISSHISPNDSVLCTKFSPRHCLLVYGCLGGKLTWYQPVV